MRDFLRSGGRWLSSNWLWPLALLALPACAFQTNGIQNPDAFDPGTAPLTGEVMCDIPKPPFDDVKIQCATAADVMNGMNLANAAVALGEGAAPKPIGLDYSPEALNVCNGMPRKTEFFGPFPDGSPVCLNCMQQIPSKYSTPTAVCVAKCRELVTMSGMIPEGGVDAYCQANARMSTNFAQFMCFDKGCTNGGTPVPNFVDPRRAFELVKWTDSDLIGSSASGNSLTRMAPTTGPTKDDFNAGGASDQLITKGDAWVDFSANDNSVSQVLGVRESCDDITACPDTDPSLKDIGFSIILNSDHYVYVIESSPTVTTFGPYGTYNPNERYRIHITDNSDGTATISYWRVTGSCTSGSACVETMFYQHTGPNPKYPLRIDASFREQNATVANVTMMRIQ